MFIAFASIDQDYHPVLACSSIELSTMNNTLSKEILDPLVD
jgi:hypothetical protein